MRAANDEVEWLKQKIALDAGRIYTKGIIEQLNGLPLQHMMSASSAPECVPGCPACHVAKALLFARQAMERFEL